MAGQILSQFNRVACLFNRLNAFVASTRIIASVSSSTKRYSIAWTAASHPASCPAHNWMEPMASWSSHLTTFITAFPTILRAISPIPTGRTPRHLSSGTRRQEIYAFTLVVSTKVVHILLATLQWQNTIHWISLQMQYTVVSSREHPCQKVQQIPQSVEQIFELLQL